MKKKVTWTTALGAGEVVRVELWRNGAFSDVLVNATKNDGSCNVKIPEETAKGKGYAVRVLLNSDPAVFDESDAPFTVK